MILTFNEFEQASEIVERILSQTCIDNIETELRQSATSISVERQRAYYNHINSLFLNVLLNRLDEPGIGNDAREKSIRARQILNTL